MTYFNNKLAIMMIYPHFSLIFINSLNSHTLCIYQAWAPAVNQTPYAQALHEMVERMDMHTMQTII